MRAAPHGKRRRARRHDLAERVPSAMIFLRSPGGISHDPAETVLLEGRGKGDRSRNSAAGPTWLVTGIFGRKRRALILAKRAVLINATICVDSRHVCARCAAGMKKATAIVHVGPALGAAFTEYTAESKTAENWEKRRRSALCMCWRV